MTKGYIALFVCFVTKAILIELVIAAFLAAFRRFTARRGQCAEIFSYCETYFVGANRELREMLQALMSQSQPTDQGCTNEVITNGQKTQQIAAPFLKDIISEINKTLVINNLNKKSN